MRQSPSSEPSGNDSVSRCDVNQTHDEILEYWTEQRMAEARPRELLLPEEGPRLKQRGADTGASESGPEASAP
ncbi:hypothetical protein [Pseudarthrobacter sp. NamE5]|uniref:hypothetical protein n=1 Tax=Pseudarthrobacter sp. NamE5 TaxID=2576839 RepID=UPI00110A8620|nr:hypothetical protein [Pseudarthrobacter sp. NamE5]TLM86082.1 hypothetical protein FDW84_07405 [Pseudarthrobacter sp. NamE5]